MKTFNELREFKKFGFKSNDEQEITTAVKLLEKLGYELFRNDFSLNDAAKHNGVCAWDDGEITEGWLAVDGFAQVTLEDLKKMVGEDKEVLWLNIETLKEKCLNSWVCLKGFEWVKVPDGATFATGDKGKFVFRKDGWYYDNQEGEWVEGDVTIQNLRTHELVKLFWVKSDKDNTFTLKRLLGCEVLFGDTIYYVIYIYYSGAVGQLVLENDTRRAYVSDFNLLTFFTEDGDELTFDEYVEMYYGELNEHI